MLDARSSRRALALCALATGAAGCTGEVGTLEVSLVTSPGEEGLPDVVRGRLTLTSPRRSVDADRGPEGFAFDLDVTASGERATLVFEGFDAGGQRRVLGQTPPFPVAAIDASVAIFVATPETFAEAPVALPAGRAEVGLGPLGYGALLVGGRAANGAPVAELSVYDAYRHELVAGVPLPEGRAGVTVSVGTAGYAYLSGGETTTGPASLAYRFDTTVSPAGQLDALVDDPRLARVGAASAPLGADRFLVMGTSAAPAAVVLDGFLGTITAIDTPAALRGVAASVERVATGEVATAIVGAGAGATGAGRFVDDTFEALAAPASASRVDHAALALPDGRVLAIGGAVDGVATRHALVVDPFAGTVTELADLLTTPRRHAAVALSSGRVLVIGGEDDAGTPLADAEIFAATSLAALGVVPLGRPRSRAAARGLANGQVLVVGGRDAAGPLAELELSTPTIDLGE